MRPWTISSNFGTMVSSSQCVFWYAVRTGRRLGRCNECFFCLQDAWLLFVMQRLGIDTFRYILRFRDGPGVGVEHWEEEELENALEA